MLQEVATRLSACVSQDDTVARMGGDEFTLLLPSQGDREIALKRAIQVAELILGRLARPFTLEGREFFVTASIGVALSPQDGAELSLLMKNADTAMYHAKEMGKNNFQFYQAEMNARSWSAWNWKATCAAPWNWASSSSTTSRSSPATAAA